MLGVCWLPMLAVPSVDELGPVTRLPEWMEWVLIVAVWGVVLFTYVRGWIKQTAPARLPAPGLVQRRIVCPERGRRARIEVLCTEPAWGLLKAADVVRCSVFGAAPVSCAKKCLSQL